MSNIKRFLSVFMSLIIVLSAAFFCVPKIKAQVITTMYIDGTDVRVREKPSLDGTIIEKIGNTTATVLGSTSDNKYTWYHISYTGAAGESTGYVAYDSSYIRIVTYDPDTSTGGNIDAFPESYRASLNALHKEYPNWVFIPDPVSNSFDDIVYHESLNMYKQVSLSGHSVSWRSMGPGAYDWGTSSWVNSNKGWTGASKEIIAYYLDPRNFLNSSDIYQYLQQGYDSKTQTIAGVRQIVSGTFMATNYSDPNDTAYGGDYAAVIMEAAKQSGVSPYILAAKIRQEIGVNAGTMVSGTYPGYEGLYNFYNFNASGNGEQVYINGLTYARSKGWTTRSFAIIDGAKNYSSNYISGGQDTFFLQDYDVHKTKYDFHQFAQNVADAYQKGRGVRNEYMNEKGMALTFKIPVFTGMPANPVPMPPQNNALNNYYLGNMSVSGLTPSFSRFTYDYSLQVNGDTAILSTPIMNSASIVSASSFALKTGVNNIKITVKAETGATNSYNISVNATKNCTLYVNATGTVPGGNNPSTPSTPSNPSTPTVTVKKGDTNGDNQITLRDLANVRLHLLGLKPLTGTNLTGADTNGDNQITLRDLANIRLHLLGLKIIS